MKIYKEINFFKRYDGYIGALVWAISEYCYENCLFNDCRSGDCSYDFVKDEVKKVVGPVISWIEYQVTRNICENLNIKME